MQISKWIVALVAIYGGLGGIAFDAIIPATSRQHLWNAAWPPHAKFHNGQTMLMGLLNAMLVVVILFAFEPLTLPLFLAAAALTSILFVAMLGASGFPGTAWGDPEFADVNPQPLGLAVQKLIALVGLALVISAVALRLRG